jgi:hypothetical protein
LLLLFYCAHLKRNRKTHGLPTFRAFRATHTTLSSCRMGTVVSPVHATPARAPRHHTHPTAMIWCTPHRRRTEGCGPALVIKDVLQSIGLLCTYHGASMPTRAMGLSHAKALLLPMLMGRRPVGHMAYTTLSSCRMGTVVSPVHATPARAPGYHPHPTAMIWCTSHRWRTQVCGPAPISEHVRRRIGLL